MNEQPTVFRALGYAVGSLVATVAYLASMGAAIMGVFALMHVVGFAVPAIGYTTSVSVTSIFYLWSKLAAAAMTRATGEGR